MLPPPGIYAGGVAAKAEAFDFRDGSGQPIPALAEARLKRVVGGPLFAYVPDVTLWGGSIGLAAVLPIGRQCGRLFAGTPQACESGFGDPYIEAMWSRSFGTVRASRFSGALPIVEGLTIAAAFGAVLPIGQYNKTDPTTRVLSSGSNIWDFAPSVAFTYTTPPLLVEGTEFSVKAYWNNYLENPATRYLTGSLVNVDFAVSERIGRFQVGPAGFYAFQVGHDERLGVRVPPDGQRASVLSLGGVIAYDMPELGAGLKIKVLRSIDVSNTANAYTAVVSIFKKVH